MSCPAPLREIWALLPRGVCIPRSHRFACSRPFRLAKGALGASRLEVLSPERAVASVELRDHPATGWELFEQHPPLASPFIPRSDVAPFVLRTFPRQTGEPDIPGHTLLTLLRLFAPLSACKRGDVFFSLRKRPRMATHHHGYHIKSSPS